MAYRYLFVLLGAVSDMYVARKARTIAAGPVDHRAGRRFVAATAGALFGKAHALSEEVHMAMLARGYRGEARTLDGFRVRALDVAWAAAAALSAIAIVVGDRGLAS
jgi:energy-coupling factor transporter transmembrane protein EcfT